ncbi:hypothetical protein [uncultured Sporomusa sp.]|nr:hypothetical protein [uncultured Sporomusa sp.]
MSDEFNINQQFNDQAVSEFALPAVIVTAPRTTSYDWYSIWNNIFARIAPQNPAFINPTLTQQNRIDGYRFRENPLEMGLFWRVTASGRVHPDDLKQYERQKAILYSYMSSVAEDEVIRLEQESSKDGFNKLYASAGMSDMLPYSVGAEDITADADYFSMWRMAIFGHDNSELANNQFKKAVDDTIYKDIYPLMLDITKIGVTILAGNAGPYAPGVAATGNFVIEAAKQKTENYDRFGYTWENALVDAGKETGIDLVTGMGAKEMSQVIAVKFSLPEPTRFGLEKGLDYLLKKGVGQFKDK